MLFSISDKVVVLIGGAGLLGRAFARSTGSHGAITVIADVDATRTDEARDETAQAVPEGRFETESVDMTDAGSLDAMIARVSARHGRIDAVVNGAYPRNSNYGRKLEDVTYADFCENLNLHLGGYFLSSQRFAEFFRAQGFGHVINVSSIYGVVAPRFDIYEGTPMTMPVEYAACKAALQHLSRYFMRYYKGTPLRFNCVSPGGILDKQPAAFVAAYSEYSQHEGMLMPDDICGALLFLLSDYSRFVNGQNIIVDDGWTA
jgi:NAD(P)-dependent dehydrogenase (short-subunit alcohol dehydrogenase family)